MSLNEDKGDDFLLWNTTKVIKSSNFDQEAKVFVTVSKSDVKLRRKNDLLSQMIIDDLWIN